MGRQSQVVGQSIVPGASRSMDWFQGPNSQGIWSFYLLNRYGLISTAPAVSAKIGVGAEGALLMNAGVGPIVNTVGGSARRVVTWPFDLVYSTVGASNYSTIGNQAVAAYGGLLAWSAALLIDPTSCAGAWWSEFDGNAGNTGELRANVGGNAYGITMISDGSIQFVAKDTTTGVAVYTATPIGWPNAVTVLTKFELRIFNATGITPPRIEVRVNDLLALRANFGTIGLPVKYGTLVPGYSLCPVISNFQAAIPPNPLLYYTGLYGWAGAANDSTF